jgi:hypothetical protein
LASDAKAEIASPTISADLWRQLKHGSLVLAAGFDVQPVPGCASELMFRKSQPGK